MKAKPKINIKGSVNVQVSLYITSIVISSLLITLALYFLLYRFNIVGSGGVSVIGIIASILVACEIVAAFVTGIISLKFIKPVEEAIEAINRLSEGDYSKTPIKGAETRQLKALKEAVNKTADDLSRTEIMQKDFISTVSHEYKTPVASISGYADLLKRTDLTKEQNTYVDIIVNEAHRLSSMTEDVLLLNKFENTQEIAGKTLFSLDEQLRKCFQLLQNDWLSRDITISGDFEKVMYYGNEELLEHVWTNLIRNAIKYAGRGGEITCSVTESAGFAWVRIRDNGCGMDEETQLRVFDKFYHKDTESSSEGNGLGLSIAKRIVELCEGKIMVNSEPGEGAEFVVVIPNAGPEKEKTA